MTLLFLDSIGTTEVVFILLKVLLRLGFNPSHPFQLQPLQFDIFRLMTGKLNNF